MIGIKKKGFTLVEILTAMAITATISVGLYSLMSQIHTSSENSSKMNEDTYKIQHLSELFRNEMLCVYWPSVQDVNEKTFELVTDNDGQIRLSYYSLCPCWYGFAQSAKPAKITYLVTEEQAVKKLIRSEQLASGGVIIGETVSEVVLMGFEKMKLLVYDGRSKEWVRNADSGNALPLAVKVIYSMYGDENIEMIFEISATNEEK